MGVLSNFEPKEVLYYFEEITKIPHGSFNCGPIADYLVNFAKERGLEHYRDEANNVIIIKEAAPGYEDAPAVILQGHTDMVCQKTPDSDFDFEKDALRLEVDGDLILAKDTTLGGDDGIAVAYALAVLASDKLEHPRVEVLLTSDEEVGLLGAEACDLSMLKGKMLINIDSEEEGIFLTSCAGGARVNLTLPVERVKKEGMAYEVTVQGLTGGHSGTEINKGRANASKLLGRLLLTARKEAEFALDTLEGGQADNVIPRQATATVLVEEGDAESFEKAVKELEETFKKEQSVADPGLNIKLVCQGKKEGMVLDRSSMTQTLTVLTMMPDGVQAMSMQIPGLVETSLNLGIMKLGEKELELSSAVRSSVGSKKQYMFEQLRTLIEYAGGTMDTHGDYPAWEFVADSHLREVFAETYKDIYGKEAQIEAIHAGLECGILSNKIEGLDCISLGPDMQGVHTTEERLSISSTERTWKLLVEALKRLK